MAAQVRYASMDFRVEYDREARRVTIIRMARRFASESDTKQACQPVIDAIAGIDRTTHTLLLDVRDAIAVSDSAYEGWYAPYRRAFIDGFVKAAIVVRTAIGKLQVARLTTTDGHTLDIPIFVDVRAAHAYLDK